MGDLFFLLLQKLLPKRLFSGFCARIGECSHPVWFKNFLIKSFMRFFRVDMSDASRQDPESYFNFNDFFTRSLLPESRPLGHSDIVCPADGVISQFGSINNDLLIQAKDRFFSLSDLLAEKEELVSVKYEFGSFITIYLAPSDYHRFHMPVAGDLLSTCYVPGALYSVNHATSTKLENLYARNERYIANFISDKGPFSIVAVGAMIVAGIETVWSGLVVSSRSIFPDCGYRLVEDSISLGKGEEAGRFRLGSTIILLFPGGVVWDESLQIGQKVKMGQSIANWEQDFSTL